MELLRKKERKVHGRDERGRFIRWKGREKDQWLSSLKKMIICSDVCLSEIFWVYPYLLGIHGKKGILDVDVQI